jgi:predicted amidohydrolase
VTLRVAAVQAVAAPGEVSRNIQAAAHWVGRATQEGAQLIVLPEAFVTGYDVGVFSGCLPYLEDVDWLAPLQEIVEASQAVVVLNSPLDRGDRRTLTDIVLSAGSPPWAAYDKQHLYPLEREVFTPGEHGASIQIGDVEVALSICYDGNFPEHASAAAADGAVAYVNSGAYFPGGGHRRDLHYAARALDNGMYVAFSGLVGGSSGFIGGSATYDPTGQVIERLDTQEGIAVADIDPAMVEHVRADQRMWADRRASLGTRSKRILT